MTKYKRTNQKKDKFKEYLNFFLWQIPCKKSKFQFLKNAKTTKSKFVGDSKKVEKMLVKVML